MSSKDDILRSVRDIFHTYFLWTREGLMPTITKSGLIASEETPFMHAWARLPPIGINQDSAIIDLAYWFAGLVTITQSHLVHCILKWVEHTDPTEWSNLHLSIGDKFITAVRWTAHVVRHYSRSFSTIHFSQLIGCGSTKFLYYLNARDLSELWLSTIYTHNVLFYEQLLTQ